MFFFRNASCHQDTFLVPLSVVAAAFTILVTSTALAILVTGTFLTILVTSTALTILVTGTFLTILVASTALAILVTGTLLTILMTGTALAILVTGTALCTFLMVTAVVSAFAGIVVAASMSGTTAATSSTFFGTAAGRQFGSCCWISLHVIGVVTQLAHLLTQLVGIGSLRVIVNGQLRRFHIVRVRLHALEIRHVLFEFVGALLTHTIGLNRHGLLPFGGRFALLRTHAQRNQAY